MIDISDTGLNEVVVHKKYGQGTVIECSEKPSIKVRFSSGLVKVFTDKNATELEAKYEVY